MSTDVARSPIEPPSIPAGAPGGARELGMLELLLVAVGLAALMAGELAVCKPRLVMDGPFWLDECLTAQIVLDPSIGHSIAAIRHGVDTNPPVYHLIARGYWKVFGRLFRDSPRITLRSLSLLCTWLALVGVYALLRGGFSIWPAIIGTLAVSAHPDVVEQAVNARFYAPLLAATVATCLAMRRRGTGIGRGILVAICAALLCTLHYFGILILGCICLAMLLVDEGSVVRRLIRLLPAAAGPVALAPFLFFIRTQSAGLTVKTWLDPFSAFLAGQFLVDVLCTLPLLVAVAAWVIGQLIRSTGNDRRIEDRPALLAATVPMLAMALVPVTIVIFSAMVQSALRPRYAIAAALVLGPVAAMLGARLGRYVLVGLAVALSGLAVMKLHGVESLRQTQLDTLTYRRDAVENQDPALPIYLTDRGQATELLTFAPELFPRMHLLDMREPGIALDNYRLFETETIGKVSPYYPLPPLVPAAHLQEIGKFDLIAPEDDLPALLLEVPMVHREGLVYEAVKP
ncbi:MAG TPA: glycosyltransferase family 39 protein [Tepidisphaeraceae bacterium]|jgi:hypothetical protein|nr:glycosyltransferase family 39 protein [Tepidisphaeraceae bacterium]